MLIIINALTIKKINNLLRDGVDGMGFIKLAPFSRQFHSCNLCRIFHIPRRWLIRAETCNGELWLSVTCTDDSEEATIIYLCKWKAYVLS